MRTAIKRVWLSLLLLVCGSLAAVAGADREPAPADGAPPAGAMPALPEGGRGIAAKHPGDRGIADDPAVLFHDDFEAGHPRDKWDNVFHE